MEPSATPGITNGPPRLLNDMDLPSLIGDDVEVPCVDGRLERYVNLALEHLEQLPDDYVLDGQVRSCAASTRPLRRERGSRSRCRGSVRLLGIARTGW